VVQRAGDADAMTLRCEVETSDDRLARTIAESLQRACKVKGEVELVAPGALPNDGKVIDDQRSYE
jgi:phenylacetate-CoA ligase